MSALAAPSPVTDIKAERVGGQIHVSWQKLPESEQIAYYRIFFSAQSIIKNNGQYDDFDIAQGSVSEHTLTGAPGDGALYISVLAVNDKSEESPVFAEEATVTAATAAPSLPPSPSIPSSQSQVPGPESPVPSPQLPTSGTFSILSAEAISSTGVLVTFPAPVQVSPADTAKIFTISDASGAVLAINHLVFSGSTVTVVTEAQDGMKVYQLSAAQALQGTGSGGTVLVLDAAQGTMLFAGFGGGGRIVAGAQEETRPPEIDNLTLRGEPDGDGRYSAEAGWEVAGGLALVDHFLISQTIDRGKTFGTPQVLSVANQHIRISGIPAGPFGLRVQVVMLTGQTSEGMTELLELGQAGSEPSPALPASVTPADIVTTPEPTRLTQSGMTPFALIAIVGAAIGFAVIRRRTSVPV